MRLDLFDSDGRAAGDPRGPAEEFVSRLRAGGFGPGEVLAVALPNGPVASAAFIACVRLGVTFAAINPSLSPSELQERVKAAANSGPFGRATATTSPGPKPPARSRETNSSAGPRGSSAARPSESNRSSRMTASNLEQS